MKNKIIIGVIAVLAVIFIFENAYLLGRYNAEHVKNIAFVRYQPVPIEVLPENNLPIIYKMSSWDPFTEINRMQERMNRIFENNFSAASNIGDNKASFGSSISFSNNGTSYMVKVGMPGITKDDIDIQVKGRQLIISGQNKNNKASKGKDYYNQESSYGNFLSNFMLPEDAQINRITSDYKDGVLTISIPLVQNKPSKPKEK
ncbi:MAG: Hsp20/alpha crystallin family protein [Candidatus Omnitrophica bacterium]|nr:Hsp20/alpha crystallin family protein [Candidatus Omnitrophota bacterium]